MNSFASVLLRLRVAYARCVSATDSLVVVPPTPAAASGCFPCSMSCCHEDGRRSVCRAVLRLVTQLPVTFSMLSPAWSRATTASCVGLSSSRRAPHTLSRVSPAIDSPARDSSYWPDPVWISVISGRPSPCQPDLTPPGRPPPDLDRSLSGSRRAAHCAASTARLRSSCCGANFP